MAHRSKVVDLIRLYLLDDTREIHRVCHIAIVQDKVSVFHVRILVEVVDTVRVEE